jgi:hypothetical protein
MRAIWWFPVTVGVLVGGCDIVHEQGNGGTAGTQGQNEPPGAQGDPLPAAAHDRVAVSGHVVTEESARTDLIPVGYPSGHLNVLTGIRTDPRGSEEGYLSNEEVGLMDTNFPAPTHAVPFDVAGYGMWGSRGPGGVAGGSALLSEAPITSHPGTTAAAAAVQSRSHLH